MSPAAIHWVAEREPLVSCAFDDDATSRFVGYQVGEARFLFADERRDGEAYAHAVEYADVLSHRARFLEGFAASVGTVALAQVFDEPADFIREALLATGVRHPGETAGWRAGYRAGLRAAIGIDGLSR